MQRKKISAVIVAFVVALLIGSIFLLLVDKNIPGKSHLGQAVIYSSMQYIYVCLEMYDVSLGEKRQEPYIKSIKNRNTVRYFFYPCTFMSVFWLAGFFFQWRGGVLAAILPTAVSGAVLFGLTAQLLRVYNKVCKKHGQPGIPVLIELPKEEKIIRAKRLGAGVAMLAVIALLAFALITFMDTSMPGFRFFLLAVLMLALAFLLLIVEMYGASIYMESEEEKAERRKGVYAACWVMIFFSTVMFMMFFYELRGDIQAAILPAAIYGAANSGLMALLLHIYKKVCKKYESNKGDI